MQQIPQGHVDSRLRRLGRRQAFRGTDASRRRRRRSYPETIIVHCDCYRVTAVARFLRRATAVPAAGHPQGGSGTPEQALGPWTPVRIRQDGQESRLGGTKSKRPRDAGTGADAPAAALKDQSEDDRGQLSDHEPRANCGNLPLSSRMVHDAFRRIRSAGKERRDGHGGARRTMARPDKEIGRVSGTQGRAGRSVPRQGGGGKM